MRRTGFFAYSILTLFFVLPLLAEAVPQSNYEYWVRIPLTSKSCSDEAKLLADRFISAARGYHQDFKSLRVLSYKCRGIVNAVFEGRTHQLYSLLLTYEAKNKVPVTSTKIGYEILPFASQMTQGRTLYPSFRSCINDIPAQLDLYEQQTRREAIAVYCELNSGNRILNKSQDHTVKREDRATAYTLVIEGVGRSESWLTSFSLPSMTQEDPYIQAGLLDILRSYGAVIAKEIHGGVFYYTDKKIPIQSWSFPLFFKYSECIQQLSEARSILFAAGSTQTYVSCHRSNASKTVMNSISNSSKVLIANELFLVSYYSFEECKADLDRSIREESLRRMRPMIGGICSARRDGTYFMTIYQIFETYTDQMHLKE